MFNHCRLCVCVCVWERLCVRACVCVCVRVRHDTWLRCKNDQMSLLLFEFFFFCLFRLYLRPLWSTLLFYYLLLSDYWPSCYIALQRAHTNLFTTPLYQSQMVDSLAIQVIHKVGFYWILLHFFNILLQRNTLVNVWKLLVFFFFGVLNAMLHFIWSERDWCSWP